METAIASYNRQRGIAKTSIHLFRYTFAQNWIVNGGGREQLQKILGHSSSRMTDHYIQISGIDLKKDFATYNPLEKYVNHKKQKIII